MKKQQKKMLEDLIETLFEAHDEIRKLMKKGDPGTSMDLMAQCQDGIIKVGTVIEESEGEGFVTVGIIEEYCELLFHAYEEAGQQAGSGNKASFDKQYKILNRKLIQVQNSIKNDIVARIEAVFLPYKASMWDSLESVWKAAEDDPACDAYVVPIPYYDKKPDGALGQEHYEGSDYPDYVPVTHYGEYDLAARRPDMVFIHNPYDEINIVTSVHPFYYSKNLKQYTDELIYIPYFILGDIKPDNKEAIEKMQHYCTTPGVIHADKTIVQSEDMRQIYIDVLSEALGEHTRPVWKEKILGLGSPKLDRVAGMDRDTLDIPEDWRRIIENPDGSRKKIIFYCTSINALLKHEGRMLKKMREVFRTFKENKDEVALLWRPHPLIPATIDSMLPELAMEYQQMVEEYRREGWGIYDDTPDVERAVHLSDGYYGDPSSVTTLYKQTGKPIMILTVPEEPEEDEEKEDGKKAATAEIAVKAEAGEKKEDK